MYVREGGRKVCVCTRARCHIGPSWGGPQLYSYCELPLLYIFEARRRNLKKFCPFALCCPLQPTLFSPITKRVLCFFIQLGFQMINHLAAFFYNFKGMSADFTEKHPL